MRRDGLFSLVLLWLGWFASLYGFQWAVIWCIQITAPDHAVEWSARETLPDSNAGKIFLLEPFLNRQVAWDFDRIYTMASLLLMGMSVMLFSFDRWVG